MSVLIEGVDFTVTTGYTPVDADAVDFEVLAVPPTTHTVDYYDAFIPSFDASGACAILLNGEVIGNGVLLWTRRHILTTASVASQLEAPFTNVTVLYNTVNQPFRPAISSCTLHPQYNLPNYHDPNNIAVITLVDTVHGVSAHELYPFTDVTYRSDFVRVTCSGRTNPDTGEAALSEWVRAMRVHFDGGTLLQAYIDSQKSVVHGSLLASDYDSGLAKHDGLRIAFGSVPAANVFVEEEFVGPTSFGSPVFTQDGRLVALFSSITKDAEWTGNVEFNPGAIGTYADIAWDVRALYYFDFIREVTGGSLNPLYFPLADPVVSMASYNMPRPYSEVYAEGNLFVGSNLTMSGGDVYWTTDAARTWTTSFFDPFLSAFYSNGLLLATGSTEIRVRFLEDEAWTIASLPLNRNFRSLVYFKGKWFAGALDAYIFSSEDGITWDMFAPGANRQYGVELHIIEEFDTLVAWLNGGPLWATTDGESWSQLTTGLDSFGDNEGSFAVIGSSLFRQKSSIVRMSANITDWTAPVGLPAFGLSAVTNTGLFVAANNNGYVSTDAGLTWAATGSIVKGGLARSLKYINGMLFALGGDGCFAISYDDGRTWTNHELRTNFDITWGPFYSAQFEMWFLSRVSGTSQPHTLFYAKDVRAEFLPLPSPSGLAIDSYWRCYTFIENTEMGRIQFYGEETDAPGVMAEYELEPPPDPWALFSGCCGIRRTWGGVTSWGSGTLLTGGRCILTAAHVVWQLAEEGQTSVRIKFFDDNIERQLGIETIVFHPFTGPEEFGWGIDLAILVLTEPVAPSITRHDIYRDSDEIGQEFEKLGYSAHVDPETGEMPYGSGYGDRVWHHIRNKFEALNSDFPTHLPNGQQIGLATHWPPGTYLIYDFDSGSEDRDIIGEWIGIVDLGVESEGGTRAGDSGSASFINGKVAGVTMGGFQLAPWDLYTDMSGTHGELGMEVRVSAQAEWVDSVVSLYSEEEEQPPAPPPGPIGTALFVPVAAFLSNAGNALIAADEAVAGQALLDAAEALALGDYVTAAAALEIAGNALLTHYEAAGDALIPAGSGLATGDFVAAARQLILAGQAFNDEHMEYVGSTLISAGEALLQIVSGTLTATMFGSVRLSLRGRATLDGTLTASQFTTAHTLRGGAVATGTAPTTTAALNATAANEAYLTGTVFKTTPGLYTAGRLTAMPFATNPVLAAERGIELTGGGFTTAPELFGASGLIGTGFTSSPILTATATNESWLTGEGFITEPVITVISETSAFVTGGVFTTEPSLYSGANLVGGGFVTSLNADVSGVTSAYLTGGGFITEAVITAEGMAVANLTGSGFITDLWTVVDGFVHGSPTLTGTSFVTMPILRASELVSPSHAFVMNIRSTEVSRYTDYPFKGFLKIAGKYYGVQDDGLYLIEAEHEGAAYVETKETDFGIYQSKNVPYAYLNSDTVTSITPIVDTVESNTHSAQFGGRKTHLARGLAGRYWRFRISNIQRIEGVEFLPELKQRRVK